MPRISAKNRRRKTPPKQVMIPLDREKPPRGRRPRVRVNEITGHAENNLYIFGQVWDKLWSLLSSAKNEADVEKAFQEGAGNYYNRTDVWSSSLVLRTLRDPKFPKRRKAQIKFMAESLAGLDSATPRYSRDICAKERARAKSAHHIIRHEFYIECSCRYKGRSHDHACPKCGAQIVSKVHSMFDTNFI